MTTLMEYRKTSAEALAMLVRSASFLRPFTREDWVAFAGCESPAPQIAEWDDYTIVLDGDSLLVLHATDEDGGQVYQLTGDLR